MPSKTGNSEYNRKYTSLTRVAVEGSTPQRDKTGSIMRLPNHQIIEYASTYHVRPPRCRATTRTSRTRPNGHPLKFKRSMRNRKLPPSLRLPITAITNLSLARRRFPPKGPRSSSWGAASYRRIPHTSNAIEPKQSNPETPASPSSIKSTLPPTQQQDLHRYDQPAANHLPLDLQSTDE